jgi:DNA mismatch repair protein MutL
VTHAIRLAYQDLIPAKAHPVVVLFIDLNPAEVDVNVHPSKTEIRFRDSQRVHSAIYHGLEEALLKSRSHFSSIARNFPSDSMTGDEAGPQQDLTRNTVHFFRHQPDSSMGFREFRTSSEISTAAGSEPLGLEMDSAASASANPHRYDIPETAYLSPVPVVLGQFVESFIIAADREGVMLIDQHVAHERVLYDQALCRMDAGKRMATQKLLIPLTIELSADQAAVLEDSLAELAVNGFEVEHFGNRTMIVRGVPEVAVQCGDAGRLLQEILDDLKDSSPGFSRRSRVQRLTEKIAISLSCRSAIKINTPLASDKMQWLVDALFRTRNPYTCPHGRPIVLRLGIEDVLRGFKRI